MSTQDLNSKPKKKRMSLLGLMRFYLLPRSIRVIILVSFSAVSILIMAILGMSVSNLFVNRTQAMMTENTKSISKQETLNIEEYLSHVRNIANAIYYDVIKDTDLSDPSINDKISLLYASNSNEIVSIALYQDNGDLLNASPTAQEKPDIDVTEQSWFTKALAEPENMHFSEPHVQNLFLSPSYTYNWVITCSTAVDMTDHGSTYRGVLMIDMRYNTLDELLENSNTEMSDRYSYLMSDEGSIIYHPKQSQIHAGLDEENTEAAARYTDGAHYEMWKNQDRIVVTNTISYTGWKLVSVIPNSTLRLGEKSITNLMIMITSLTLMVMLLINRYIANRISDPLIRLNDAISNMEGVRNIPSDVYENSSKEVRELGTTLHSYLRQINRLMEEMVREEGEKRKSELDALQAQINPHFLYNTLDSIVWMIEGEKYKDAVFMITQLASFFRQSLNRGKSMISIGNELKQAQAYLNIQKVRYKQSFTDIYEIEDGIEDFMIVKLVIQPILENAIYHGIKEAEQDGEIRIKAVRDDDDILISISDNGYGMTEEEVNTLLVESARPAVEKHGSGVGLINVDQRLRLRFGEEYGLHVESELDEGTTVTVRIPAIPATEENLKRYEDGEVGKNNA